MDEYIDKNAAVGILEAMSRSADCECIKKRLEKAAKRVSAIPAADVAPVVRCKDCIYTRNLYGRSVCKYGACSGYILREDFFCADGTREETRKDGDDNAVD